MKLDPPPDLVEIAEALDAMAKPHVGSGWANTNYTDLPCTTPRQEAIWMEFNGITRGGGIDGKARIRAARERLLRQRQGA